MTRGKVALLNPPFSATILANLDGDCPNCGERFPTPAERQAIDDQIANMDAQTCGDIKSALMSLPIYIFTDEDVKQEAGGAWVLYDNGNTEIYLSEDIWSLSGAQFEDELYKKLSHEGAHEVAFQDNGGLENWGSMDYHGEAWSTKFQTCYSN